MRHPRLAVAASAVAVAVLSGCAPTVAMQPAAHADDPGCADVIVRLPTTVDDLTQRTTNAQSTGAWGDPTSVLLYCGVEVPSASTLTCIEVDGRDWLLDDSAAPTYVLRLYGREPAIDVVVDADAVDPVTALGAFDAALAHTVPNDHVCLATGSTTP